MVIGIEGHNAAVVVGAPAHIQRICGLMNQNRCCYSSILNFDGLLALDFCAQSI